MTTPISASGYNIELRDKNGNLKKYLTPFVTNVSWEWNRIGGCGNCSLTVNKAYRSITFNALDDIQIRIKSGSTSKLVYRGYIANVVPTLDKNETIKINVRGYFDLLKKIIVHDTGDTKTYTTDTVLTIADDIATNFIYPNSPIKVNMSLNAGLELWSAGDSAAPDDWTLGGGGGMAVAKESTIKKYGSFSAKLTRTSSPNSYIYSDDVSTVKGIAYWKGRDFVYGRWVYADQANTTLLQIDDGVGSPSTSSYHSGTPGWEWLEVTRKISATATYIKEYCVTVATTPAYFDNGISFEGRSIPSHFRAGLITAGTFECDSIKFLTTVEDALNTLANLSGDVEYGVDENLIFFWVTESETLRKKFVVGDNVEMLERKVDYDKLVNKAYLVGGTVDGAKYKRTAENTDSQTEYYLSEKIVNNGSITTDTVADQYLGSVLTENARPQLAIRAKVANTDIRLEDTLPIGLVTFYDAEYDKTAHDSVGDIIGEAADGGSDITVGETGDGGSDVTVGGQFSDQVDRIQYDLSDTDERFNLTIQFGDTVLETAAMIKRLDLALANLQQY